MRHLLAALVAAALLVAGLAAADTLYVNGALFNGATFNGTSTFTGTVTSTKACAVGYTRKTPNFCLVSSEPGTGWTDATACTGRTVSTVNPLPADAKVAAIVLHWSAIALNAVGFRTNAVIFYTDAACTTAVHSVARELYSVREQVATAAGTTLGETSHLVMVPLSGTNTIHTTQTNAGGNGNADVNAAAVVGYFD